MKISTSLLRKLIREAMEDMTAEFGADDPTEHVPSLTKEAVLDKIYEILANHFRPKDRNFDILNSAVEEMYSRIEAEMRMGE